MPEHPVYANEGDYAETEKHHEKDGMINRLMERYWGNAGTPNGLNFVMVHFSVQDGM
jgi:hypothetical protein